MKLLITFEMKEKYIKMIKKQYPELKIVHSDDLKEQKKEVVDADIMISGGEARIELLNSAQHLKWIQAWSAGVEGYMREDVVSMLKEKDIKLSSMSGIHGNPIAEHVIGFIINFSHRFYDFYNLQKESRWEKIMPHQLAGKTMAVIGTGSIGREIARKARVFDIDTIGVKRDISKGVDYIDTLYPTDKLEKALNEADYVVVTVPLTEETRDMFSLKEFKQMKESAFFVNIARGEVVVEGDLIKALEKKIIAGAGLDVFEKEPLSEFSPLYQMENVYITPHVSGLHPEYHTNAVNIFTENLKLFFSDQKLINSIDFRKGY